MSLQTDATPAAPSPAAGAAPAWVQLAGAAVLALVALVFVGVLAIIGKPIPDALVGAVSFFSGGTLTLVRPRP